MEVFLRDINVTKQLQKWQKPKHVKDRTETECLE